ncbi:MAG: aldo/keto reductase [Candidatus Krumholzibacteriales bacterium]
MKESEKKNITRRSFLRRTAASVVGAGIGISSVAGGLSAAGQENSGDQNREGGAPSIKEYRKLGNTGWKVSDISFGNAGMKDPALLEYAMDRGINYVDTARQYYDMEKVIGKLFPEKRDKLFVTTKLMPELITADVSEEAVMKGIEDSLKRLNTDYIDCCLIHSVGDPGLGDRSRIENPAVASAFEKAIRQGKIRNWGASSHGPKMMEELQWLVDNTSINMIMPGMNMLTGGLGPVIEKASGKGVAVVAMKSLSAARKINYSAFMRKGRTARQALIKWMLAQPGIDTIAITMRSFEQIDEFVEVSGSSDLTPEEREVLEGYGMLLNQDYCRPGCDGCLASCPQDVPIHDILRYNLYFNNYGREKYAIGKYSRLSDGRKASQCRSCPGYCESSCKYHLSVRSMLLNAHENLTV